ncbi:hypothetical protein Clacol_001188 [Clathrus columnatus]|uniref:Major facilitator superfamily (MFS) profile domain-containing protein n=1 Tax=Clathrus columnatus TaxID=1419009 RepID=A0AAV4ZYM7_9AGAM|nr:hypothetical protein Clacol_001188 [Clathrus columnatus]
MEDPDSKVDAFDVDSTSSHHVASSSGHQTRPPSTSLERLNPLGTPNVNHENLLERKILRKYDLRIMPIASLLYLFAYLDRTNLGNARLQNLPEDILGGDPTGVLFDWVNSAFFFSYILVQVPATILMKLFNPRIWMGCVAIGWSICSVLMAASFNFAGIMVCRVGLGVFEAGFGPAVPLYFSFFYTKTEIGVRMACWFAFAAVAGAFGGIIAFAIQQADLGGALHNHNWKLLFIVEGIPAFILGIITIIYLPTRPETTDILQDGPERDLAIKRTARGTQAEAAGTVNKERAVINNWKSEHIVMALLDWKVYTAGVIYFGLNAALASTSAFLPTIIKTFGFSAANAQLLTVPPYACAAIVLISLSFVSDRLQSRGLFCAASSLISAIGYVILISVAQNEHVRYFAVFCITSGTYTHIGLILAWFAHNLGSESKKATVNCSLQFLAAFLAVVLSIYYRSENKRRDRLYGQVDLDAKVDTSKLADNAPAFRYLP